MKVDGLVLTVNVSTSAFSNFDVVLVVSFRFFVLIACCWDVVYTNTDTSSSKLTSTRVRFSAALCIYLYIHTYVVNKLGEEKITMKLILFI